MQRLTRSRGVLEPVPWAIAFGVGLALACLYAAGALQRFENSVYDWRFRLRGDNRRTSEFVRLVEVDDASLAGAAEEYKVDRWPWPRSLWAVLQREVIDATGSRAQLAVYDFIFDQPDDESPWDDYAFTQAAAESGNVLLASEFRGLAFESRTAPASAKNDATPGHAFYRRFALTHVDETHGDPYVADHLVLPTTYTTTFLHDDGRLATVDFVTTCAGLGFTNAPRDSDGVARRVPLAIKYRGEVFPSLPLLAAAHWLEATTEDIEVVYGRHITIRPRGRPAHRIPIDAHGALLVDFRSRQWVREYESLTYLDAFLFAKVRRALDAGEPVPAVLKSRAHHAFGELRDKLVLVGATALATQDIHPVPIAGEFPGVVLMANAIECILDERYLHPAGTATAVALIVAFALLGTWGTRLEQVRPLFATLMVFLIGGWFVYGTYQLFARWGLVVPTVAPLLALAAGHTGGVLHRQILEQQRKDRIKGVFGRIVSQDVMEELLKTGETPGMGGQERPVAILFTDIQGYTSISENLQAHEVVALLNEYFTEMVDVVLANEGTLDKYVGDSMMVVFGAPKAYDRPESFVYPAVRCGIALQRRLAEMRDKWRAEGRPEIHMRVGINYGDVVVGLIGSPKRHEYTVIGDEVNLASRLESSAPVDGVLISQAVYELIQDRIRAERMPPIRVKNIAEPVQTYVVHGLREEETCTS